MCSVHLLSCLSEPGALKRGEDGRWTRRLEAATPQDIPPCRHRLPPSCPKGRPPAKLWWHFFVSWSNEERMKSLSAFFPFLTSNHHSLTPPLPLPFLHPSSQASTQMTDTSSLKLEHQAKSIESLRTPGSLGDFSGDLVFKDSVSGLRPSFLSHSLLLL